MNAGIEARNLVDFEGLKMMPAILTGLILIATSSISSASEDANASFNGLYSSKGVDLDLNGFYDTLDLEVGVNVAVPGIYEVKGRLNDENGSEALPLSNRTYLSIGARSVVLRINGVSHPGSYRLRNLTISDSGDRVLDHIDEAYKTRHYDYFDQSPNIAKLTGYYADHGTDVNGDGKYDFLTLDVGIDFLFPGQYTLAGYLYDINGSEVGWAIDNGYFDAGQRSMHLKFDGTLIRTRGVDGPYHLENLFLTGRNWTIDEFAKQAYNTSAYRYVDFALPMRSEYEKQISGVGKGELALKVIIKHEVPVLAGSYSYDIVGINIPPISTPLNVTSSKRGYSYNLTGIYMPNKPNNFTVSASGVKTLNIGLKKLQGSYENSSMIWKAKLTRIWVTAQVEAGENGTATADSDLLSPGNYHAKIFGDATENTSQVDLTMTMIKKLIVDGRFSFAINTSGFPSGDYIIAAKALNGSFSLDEMSLNGLSLANESSDLVSEMSPQ